MGGEKISLRGYKRIVIKVGSALLVDREHGLRRAWVDGLCDDMAALRQAGADIIIVSSGSIALGRTVMQGTRLGPSRGRLKLEESQAAAAIGQIALAKAWSQTLSDRGLVAGQVLLTLGDTEERRRYLNARATIDQLLKADAVPVINENDTVATNEIRYGDNDRLAARVAQLVMADALVLLSDVDGLYTSDPSDDEHAEHIPEVGKITGDIQRMAGETRSDVGSGGMATKVQAARIATHAGCSTIIASGVIERPLESLASGGTCTVFRAEGTPASARKQWLAGVLEVRGELRLDDGAVVALNDGKSLLPVGVVEVIGNFRRGDVVTLVDSGGNELGRGLAEYSDEEAGRLAGCQSEQIEERLGYRGRSVMVHRDELVLFDHD